MVAGQWQWQKVAVAVAVAVAVPGTATPAVAELDGARAAATKAVFGTPTLKMVEEAGAVTMGLVGVAAGEMRLNA